MENEMDRIEFVSYYGDVTLRVISIVLEHFELEPEDVKLASELDKLSGDPLDLEELWMAFEEEFDCGIAPSVAQKLRTVVDVVDFIVGEME